MKASSQGRIDTLRIRVPAGDVRSAKALAMNVASRLALRVGDIAPGKDVVARVHAPASTSRLELADLIVDQIAPARRTR